MPRQKLTHDIKMSKIIKEKCWLTPAASVRRLEPPRSSSGNELQVQPGHGHRVGSVFHGPILLQPGKVFAIFLIEFDYFLPNAALTPFLTKKWTRVLFEPLSIFIQAG
jgi:hypothetical protein